MSLTKEDLNALSQLLDEKIDSKLEAHLHPIKMEIADIKQDLTALKLHVENVTDKNIRILAENHITLINKLNQAIPTAEKTLAYEVKVDYLVRDVENLKKDVEILKEQSA